MTASSIRSPGHKETVEFTLRDGLNAVFRYSRALLLFWVGTIAAVLVFYTQTRKLYDSTAKILVSLGSESEGKAEFLNDKNMQLLQREQQIHDEQQILQSHEVLETTAGWLLGDSASGLPPSVPRAKLEEASDFITGKAPESTLLLRAAHGISQALNAAFGKKRTEVEKREDIVRELSKDLSVNAVFDSDTLDVRFRYRNAQVAQTMLRLIVAAYLEHHIAVFQSAAEENLLKAQYETSMAQYRDRLAAFSAYMIRYGVYSDDTQVNGLMEQREKLQQALNEARADRASAVARLASLKSIDKSLQRFERFSTIEVRNRERDDLAAKLNDAMLEQRELLNRHPEGSRAYREEQAKLEELRSLLAQQPAQVLDQTEQRRNKASELVESDTIDVTEERRGDEARVRRLQSDMARIDSDLKRYARNLEGFDALKLQLALAKGQSEQIAQAYVNSRLRTLTNQHAITDVSLIDAPTWDWRPASPKKKLVFAAALGMLAIGSLAVLVACVRLDGAIADGATAERRVGAPVAAAFPICREDTDPTGFVDAFAQENRGEFARLYQSLRGSGAGGQVILLAECNSGEGASLLGYCLARFLSRDARAKTAFIDRTAGAMSAVATQSAAGSAGAGPGHPEPLLEMPASQANHANDAGHGADGDFIRLLESLREKFAYVVVAGGAVKEATDLLATSKLVSATLLILEAGATRRAAARYSLDMLQRYGFQNVRLILNKRVLYIPAWLMRFV